MNSSMNMFDDRINVRQMGDVIKFAQRRNRAVMFFAGPGLGKSQKVKQMADHLFGEREDNLVDFRLSDKEPQDIMGLPIPYIDEKTKETKTVFATPSFWPRDPDWKGIIFLDELTNGDESMQKVAYQIMLDHRIGEYIFPKGAVFVGAGNRESDGGATSMLLAPLANRMVIVEVDYDAEVWLSDFAMPRGLHSSIVGYIAASPDAIYTYEEAQRMNSISFSTPRSLETASEILFDLDEGYVDNYMAGILLQGAIGKGHCTQILDYHIQAKGLPSIMKVMTGEIKNHPLESHQVDLLYVLGSQGVSFLRKKMEDRTVTDDEVIKYAANFMLFMDNNYRQQNNDFVTGLFLSLTNDTALGKAVLRQNDFRQQMLPKMIKAYPATLGIVKSYHDNYASLVTEAEAA